MLSNAEADILNRRCAGAMGWTEWEEDDGPTGTWELPNGDLVHPAQGQSGLPDFCLDPHALGWMIEWLDENKIAWFLAGRTGTERYSRFTAEVGDFAMQMDGDLPGIAMAYAIVAYAEA